MEISFENIVTYTNKKICIIKFFDLLKSKRYCLVNVCKDLFSKSLFEIDLNYLITALEI